MGLELTRSDDQSWSGIGCYGPANAGGARGISFFFFWLSLGGVKSPSTQL